MRILETIDLEKNYDSFKLDRVNLTINGGEIVALVGENGAGKSTTIGCISGTRKANGGKILFSGKELNSLSESEKEGISFCYDEVSFPEDFTVSQIGKFGSLLFKNWHDQVFKDLVHRFALPENKSIKNFSKGMKAKAEIAYSLSHNPKLLVLDETTSSLDPVIRDELLELFQEFVEDGERAILFSSHITSDLEKIADRIIFIHEGRIILNLDRNDLDDKFAIAHTSKDSPALSDSAVIAVRERGYSTDLLVSDKASFKSRHPEAKLQKASIEEVLLMIARGQEE